MIRAAASTQTLCRYTHYTTAFEGNERRMTTQNHFNVDHVVYVSTNIGTGCEHCRTSIGLEHFAESINHYIEQHGYKLLHVGTETSHDNDGKPWHISVAVLGK